jgi:hypothetical protein
MVRYRMHEGGIIPVSGIDIEQTADIDIELDYIVQRLPNSLFMIEVTSYACTYEVSRT